MTLPPELREEIYKLVLIPEKNGDGGVPGLRAIVVGKAFQELSRLGSVESSRERIRSTPWGLQPALTRTSRAIRPEGLVVYYGSNHFVSSSDVVVNNDRATAVTSFAVNLDGLMKWLRSVGPANSMLVKSLELRHEFDASVSFRATPPGFHTALSKLVKEADPALPPAMQHFRLTLVRIFHLRQPVESTDLQQSPQTEARQPLTPFASQRPAVQ